jgi:enoyl-CoA hydratase/3-hydroxyacyl-CoA dehydrogenase
MSFEFRDLSIGKIGIIGSGQIGPDIALHFSKVFHAQDVSIIVVDIAEEALAKGKAKLTKKVNKGKETKAFSPEMAEKMIACVEFTSDYERLKGANLIIEAATEDDALKQKIFAQLEGICPADAVFASNSSHLEPEVIFEKIKDKSRTLVIHYFFPAERNPMVEIVPSKDTNSTLTHTLLSLYEHIGKVPIKVGSRYGYAVDPVFEGMFLASALAVEDGLGSVKEVDAVAPKAVGLRVGSFTAMNLTGGNPITNHGLDMEHQKVNKWYRSPQLMKDAIASGKPWDVPARGEKVEVETEKEKKIIEALQGAYFGIATQIVDSGITNVADLDMALEIALDMNSPFKMMNKMGIKKAYQLVEAYAKKHPEFPIPECLKKQAEKNEPWRIDYVRRHDVGEVAWVRIRRPKVLNALSLEVYDQLEEMFTALKNDPKVKAVVLSGFGIKAFVSGADINFLAKIETPEQGVETTAGSKKAGDVLANIGKPTVCALNGFALGGGLELAMCCNAILVKQGLKMAAGLPEVNLGIIPGSGGTQRLPRWVGVEKAAEMMRTTKTISSAEGVELELFREEVEGKELIEKAIELAKEAAAGKIELKAIPQDAIPVPDSLPEVDIGHRSQAIDKIISRAILEGCSKPLAEGLKVENQMFGECVKTKDMKIGINNFLENGPRAKAPFVHA